MRHRNPQAPSALGAGAPASSTASAPGSVDPLRAFRDAVLSALGNAPDEIEPGRIQRFATNGRRGDSAGWCLLFGDLRGGFFGCHRQGIHDRWAGIDRGTMTGQQRVSHTRQTFAANLEREARQQRQWASEAERLRELWAKCMPPTPDGPVGAYLRRRGFGDVWPLPACLRVHPSLPYWHEGRLLGEFPAMVSPLTAPSGRVVALHRTFLTPDGRKADVPIVKKLTSAAGPLDGASIRLHRHTEGMLGVAEGIETALAAWCASSVPTVAAYCAHALATFQWPGPVRRLIIFGDGDRAGRDAAEALRARAIAKRVQAEVLIPSEDGADWADLWAAHVAKQGGAA